MKDQVWNGVTLSKECVFCKYHPSNTAKTGGTQPTDNQQIKAEIASLVREWDECQPAYEFDMAVSIMAKLRQLSAV